MARKKVAECPDSIFHIYNRCVNKEWFVNDLDYVWDCFSTHLSYSSIVFGIQIYSFVLMRNHYHMLARFPLGNRSLTMKHFGQEVGRDLRKPSQRINQTFGGRYGATKIKQSEEDFYSVYKYVYSNPVASKQVRSVLNYKYSSLSGILGLTKLTIPIHEDFVFEYQNPTKMIHWLNEIPDDEKWIQFRRASMLAEFKLPICRKTRTKLFL